MLDFPAQFDEWLEKALSDGVPQDVAAFSFNLYEIAGADARFGVELVGTSEFDPSNSDWACAEVWEPGERRGLKIPKNYCDTDWSNCLGRVKNLIQIALSKQSDAARVLHAAQGVGVGFVDGNLELLLPN